MLFQTVGQANVFLAMVAAGALGGAWYSLLRRLSRRLEAGVLISLLIDFLYGAGLFAGLAAALFRVNYLDLRLYALIGALSGHILYLYAVPPVIDGLLAFLTRVLRRIGDEIVIKNFLQILFK